MSLHFDLGNWRNEQKKVKLDSQADDALLLFAVLDMYQTTQQAVYLSLAERIGDNVFECSANRGLFTASPNHIHCRFDDVEPLALLSLVAAKQGCREKIPIYRSRGGYIHGDMLMPDGTIKNTMDIKTIYPQCRSS